MEVKKKPQTKIEKFLIFGRLKPDNATKANNAAWECVAAADGHVQQRLKSYDDCQREFCHEHTSSQL